VGALRRRRGRPARAAGGLLLPSVANGGLAFARVYERRRGLRGDVPYLYVKKIEAQRASQRLPGAIRGRTGLSGPTALDLDDPGAT